MEQYHYFLQTCALSADEDKTKAIIEELCEQGLLQNPDLYLSWYEGWSS